MEAYLLTCIHAYRGTNNVSYVEASQRSCQMWRSYWMDICHNRCDATVRCGALCGKIDIVIVAMQRSCQMWCSYWMDRYRYRCNSTVMPDVVLLLNIYMSQSLQCNGHHRCSALSGKTDITILAMLFRQTHLSSMPYLCHTSECNICMTVPYQ